MGERVDTFNYLICVLESYMGPLMGGLVCGILEVVMLHVPVAYYPQCHMSNLRKHMALELGRMPPYILHIE